MIDAVRAFEGGYCRQLLAMVDRRSWRVVRFQAVFLALHHRREGWILVDTGYGGRFREATRGFPARFYRWATPQVGGERVAVTLARAKIGVEEIRHVIVTHFHGDHVGGLGEFAHATIHHHEHALQPLLALPEWRQVRAAFLRTLVPEWLPQRAHVLCENEFTPGGDPALRRHDLFGDGSVTLVPLPGHAPGQVGVIFEGGPERVFYAADAYWRSCQLTDGVDPLGVAMTFQWDPAAYRRTVAMLRALHERRAFRLVACHDEGVAAYLNGLGAGR